MSVSNVKLNSPEINSPALTFTQKGQMGERVVKPISHDQDVLFVVRCMGLSFSTIILILGACLWGAGSTPGMVVAGKVLVGFALTIKFCGCCVAMCIFGYALSNSPRPPFSR